MHNAFHYTLGVGRATTEWTMFALSVVLLGSMQHHLFPQVPTCHLPRLAELLEQIAPDLRRLKVF